jgi:uncharacterized protein
MASSLLILLDDIAAILDDVSVMTKVAAHKTIGVVGDDFAVNAEQVSGVRADRELPVVWAVAKGALLNKVILVPAALLISAFAPWAITPLLVIGGVFLCLEGFEKIAHRFLDDAHEDDAHRKELTRALADPAADMCQVERDKIKGAIRTDLILSGEIIVITLGAVAGSDFKVQVAVVSGIALLLTLVVYGGVAVIVKLDDFGLFLSRRGGAASRAIGSGILRAAPWLMKGLSVVGTVAMFLVGGGILVHALAPLRKSIEDLTRQAGEHLAGLAELLLNGLTGLVAGAIALGLLTLFQRMARRRATA